MRHRAAASCLVDFASFPAIVRDIYSPGIYLIRPFGEKMPANNASTAEPIPKDKSLLCNSQAYTIACVCAVRVADDRQHSSTDTSTSHLSSICTENDSGD